uniref:Ubiquitin carboxyl-terminal hydrolase 36 n=1 Tax=Panagrellus redivivus TaxID=6233 RepID=A0A7E4ZVG6_PANRE
MDKDSSINALFGAGPPFSRRDLLASMTALTAQYLLSQPFKNKQSAALPPIANGTKQREQTDHKLEFVPGGLLKPPELPASVIRLVPGSSRPRITFPDSKHKGSSSASLSNAASCSKLNGTKKINAPTVFKAASMPSLVKYPAEDEDPSSPETSEPTSGSSSSAPSGGTTPESITAALTSVPSPSTPVAEQTQDESSDDDVDLHPLLPTADRKIKKRVEVKTLPLTPKKEPQTPVKSTTPKLIGPVLPPGYKLPSTPCSPVKSSPSTSASLLVKKKEKERKSSEEPSSSATEPKSLKRKRLLSAQGEHEALYPVVESRVASMSSWRGCKIIQGQSSLKGLYNPHNNCFLNSVLQSVMHIPQFTRYILEHHQKDSSKCFGNYCLICALKGHFHRSLRQQSSANWINKYIDDIFPNHITGHQEDAHEMLLFLLDAIDRQQQRLNRSQHGKFSSIIEQVFDGKVRCEYTCEKCRNKSTCYEPVRGLSVELPRNANHPLTMNGVLKDYFRDEKISGYDCRSCKQRSVAVKRTRVLTAPNVLIIQLKRFIRFSKNSISVHPCETMDLSYVMHHNEPTRYTLLGFIKHLGGSQSSGHYTATMLGFDGQSSFLFDDESHRPLQFPNRSKPSQPYILFYAKQQDKSTVSSNSRTHFTQSTPHKRPFAPYRGDRD